MFLIFLCFSHQVCRADDWSPPPPTSDDGFDWIELTSGEWLKGNIRAMQQDKLEFDSEKLGLHSWDWKDIRTLCSPRLLSVRVGKDKVVEGSLLVTGEEVQVVHSAGIQTFARAELLAITPAGSSSRSRWLFDASVGMSARQGNIQEINSNVQATLRRLTPRTRQKLQYLGNYSQIDGVENKNDHRVLLNSDFFLTRRFFIRAPDIEYFHDTQQNLDYRFTLGCSAGYDLIKTPRIEWQVTVGPAFQRTRFDTVEEGVSVNDNSGAIVLETLFDIELTERIDYLFQYRGQFTRKSTGSNLHHTVSTLEFEIHKRLTLDLSIIWDRTADPKTGEDGVTPKKDDFQFVTSLGIHF